MSGLNQYLSIEYLLATVCLFSPLRVTSKPFRTRGLSPELF